MGDNRISMERTMADDPAAYEQAARLICKAAGIPPDIIATDGKPAWEHYLSVVAEVAVVLQRAAALASGRDGGEGK